jgi:hypothetical protein
MDITHLLNPTSWPLTVLIVRGTGRKNGRFEAVTAMLGCDSLTPGRVSDVSKGNSVVIFSFLLDCLTLKIGTFRHFKNSAAVYRRHGKTPQKTCNFRNAHAGLYIRLR